MDNTQNELNIIIKNYVIINSDGHLFIVPLPFFPGRDLSLGVCRSPRGTRYWKDLAGGPPTYCASTVSSESQPSPPTAIKMNTSLYTTTHMPIINQVDYHFKLYRATSFRFTHWQLIAHANYNFISSWKRIHFNKSHIVDYSFRGLTFHHADKK